MIPYVRKALEDGLRCSRDVHALYQDWWSSATFGEPPGAPDASEASHHAPIHWLLEEPPTEGPALASRNGQSALVSKGEWVYVDKNTVSVSRRRSWSNGPWSWRASARPAENEPSWATIRIYMPGVGESSTRFDRLCGVLDSQDVWFEAKVWQAEAAPRRDQTVVWVSGSSVEKVIAGLKPLLPEGGDVGPPPLSLSLFGGRLGLAANPPDGSSRGVAVCGALVSLGDAPVADLSSAWAAVAPMYGIDPAHPWRNAGVPDPYGVWERLESISDA
jgi:hypothetical protein